MESRVKYFLLKAASEGESLLTAVISTRLEPCKLHLGPLTSLLMNGGGQVRFITQNKHLVKRTFLCFSQKDWKWPWLSLPRRFPKFNVWNFCHYDYKNLINHNWLIRLVFFTCTESSVIQASLLFLLFQFTLNLHGSSLASFLTIFFFLFRNPLTKQPFFHF